MGRPRRDIGDTGAIGDTAAGCTSGHIPTRRRLRIDCTQRRVDIAIVGATDRECGRHLTRHRIIAGRASKARRHAIAEQINLGIARHNRITNIGVGAGRGHIRRRGIDVGCRIISRPAAKRGGVTLRLKNSIFYRIIGRGKL